MTSKPRNLAMALLAASALLVTACGSDDDDATTTTTAATSPAGDETSTPAPDDEGDDSGDDAGGDEDLVTVVMSDYAFAGLPDELAAGTRFSVENVATDEMHEVVAILLPEDETRSAAELAALPLEELGPLFGDGPPAMVLIAMPESDETIAPYGDTLTEPGRYLIACFIPIGAPMDHEGPPTPDMAPFHYEEGMYTELVVTA